MIVVDTNTIAYLYLPSRHSADVVRVLEKDAAWAVPLLWRSELRNVLAVQVRQGVLDLSLALEIQERAEQLLAGGEFAVDSAGVLALAAESGCSVYDAEFVHLAQSEGVHLITYDRALRRRFPALALTPAEFVA